MLPPPQGAEPLLCLDGIISRKLFSPNGKMLVGFASYFVFPFEVALVHPPVFTESRIWDAFSIIKYFYLCSLLLIEKITEQTCNGFKGVVPIAQDSGFLSLGHRLILKPAVLFSLLS